MIEFRYLKKIIIKSCKTESVEDLNNVYKFSINIEKLQDLLNKAGAGLKVVETNNWVLQDIGVFKSFIPTVDDIQLITEYIQKKNELEEIFNGRTEIAQFMMYIPEDENNGKSDSVTELQESSNIDNSVISKMIGELSMRPVYRVLVIHKFNKKREMFEYSIYFRSNNIMMEYINNMKVTGEEFITASDDEDFSEE